jgi:ABA/WDS induced protein
MFGHQKKENQSPVDYRKQEKHMEQLAQLGAVATGSYAMV